MKRPAVPCRRVPALVCSALAVLLVGTRPASADLRPDELLLIANRAEPASLELAQFYARARHVPDGRILTLDLPVTDDLPAHQHAREVVPAVRSFLRERHLEQQVRCLVPFYGVPLRIAGRKNTPAEAAEFTASRAALDQLPEHAAPALAAVEAFARQLNPKFAGPTTATAARDLDGLDRRWTAAAQAVVAQLATIADPAKRAESTRQFLLLAAPLQGVASKVQADQIDLQLHPDRQAAGGPALAATIASVRSAVAEAAVCATTPDDALARARFRKLAEENFGLLKYGRIVQDQLDYLDERHGGQAFDSELALVEWSVHSHNYPGGSPYAGPSASPGQRWFGNPLNYTHLQAAKGAARPPTPTTYMVVRLDGPTPDVVREMIATSIRVEQAGLRGKIVIDSLGAKRGHDPEGRPGFGPYDQMLHDLRDLLAGRPGVDVVFDDKPALLPAHAASDVALYCGWYSVNEYVPTCDFANGAVAMHIASYAMTNLHNPVGGQWAGAMLRDGAAATVGPVAEPYLFAFPRPDDFFPLLLTGKLTLAEAYWRTEAVVSWQMSCVGDPLYTPYRTNPVLQAGDLPARLRPLLADPSAESSGSAVKGTPPGGR